MSNVPYYRNESYDFNHYFLVASEFSSKTFQDFLVVQKDALFKAFLTMHTLTALVCAIAILNSSSDQVCEIL